MDVEQALSAGRFPADDIIVLENGTGTRFVVHLHGATVLSWTSHGQERLFLSSKSNFDKTNPIRGGIPVVFPNFGPWSLGPMHGFARIKRWTVVKSATQEASGDVVASFQLEDDDETRKIWNNKFRMEYTLKLSDTALDSAMLIHNTGTSSFDFTFALHTYFRVPDIHTTSVVGLQGLQFVDKMRDSAEFMEDRETVTITGSCARVYKNSPGTVYIGSGQNKNLQLTATNLPDTVVWNPWEETAKDIADLNDDGWLHFVCVEAGQVSSPVALPPGGQFQCGQKFTAMTQ